MTADHDKYLYSKALLLEPTIQTAIENLIVKYRVQCADNGYSELIVNINKAADLIDDLADLSVSVRDLSWWCLCTDRSKIEFGCPHGIGGPLNKLGEGWFTECDHYPDFSVSEALPENTLFQSKQLAIDMGSVAKNYLLNTFPKEPFYSPCLYLSLWLNVPDDWTRESN